MLLRGRLGGTVPAAGAVYTLALGAELSGISRSSILMHRYSPMAAISAVHTRCTSHHVSAAGKRELYIQQPSRWKKCTVTVKSRHCFPRRMK